MSQGRDAASVDVQAELDALATSAMGLAVQILGEHGQVFPYGVVLDEVGDTHYLVADQNGSATAAEAVDELVREVRDGRDALRAAALVSAIVTASDHDVLAELEHVAGLCLEVRLPFERIGDEIVFGDVTQTEGQRQIWL